VSALDDEFPIRRGSWLAGPVRLVVLLGPLGKPILTPIQEGVAGLFRLCGLRGLANFCAAQ